jgi:hypothetical protein
LVLPDGPGDPGEFISERDSGFVVSCGAFESECPELDGMGIGLSLGAPEDGSCAVDKEHPDIGIATLADGAETSGKTRRVFPRCESEI